jgi:hypothetical protein
MVFDVFDDSRNIITGKLGNESKDLRARPNVLTILGLPLAPVLLALLAIACSAPIDLQDGSE